MKDSKIKESDYRKELSELATDVERVKIIAHNVSLKQKAAA